jgi:hypothetical protein
LGSPEKGSAATALGQNWRAQGDDPKTFLSDFVAALPQIEFPPELKL